MSRIVDIEPLIKKYDRLNEGTEFSPIHFINDLMSLEQQPQRKKGFWVRERISISCSECGYRVNTTADYENSREVRHLIMHEWAKHFRYCPNCGAYMREGGEGENNSGC